MWHLENIAAQWGTSFTAEGLVAELPFEDLVDYIKAAFVLDRDAWYGKKSKKAHIGEYLVRLKPKFRIFVENNKCIGCNKEISKWLLFRINSKNGHQRPLKAVPVADDYTPFNIDHILAVSKGGESFGGNLQTMCWTCNVEKDSSSTEVYLAKKTADQIKMKHLKKILPDYPRTRHLPWKPNTARGDLVATEKETNILFTSDKVQVTEKVDGAQCGMTLYEGHPVIRNSDHVLAKGYVKETPAKKQFASVFQWFYNHKKQFEKLNEIAGTVGVYGEWMIAQHGLEYDQLPDYFIAFDLYDYEEHQFIATQEARAALIAAGFVVVPELFYGTLENWEQLEILANQNSIFTTKGAREGVYVKVSDDRWVTDRFKMVRQGFQQGSLWDFKQLKKNAIGSQT